MISSYKPGQSKSRIKARALTLILLSLLTTTVFSQFDQDLDLQGLSFTELDSSDFTNYGANSVMDALQGRIGGLEIISPDGEPGTAVQAFLRGNSISGSDRPLLVIDGFPQQRMDVRLNANNLHTSEMRRLIPVPLEDIKTIRVLSRPSALAMYGSEGVDGAIVIETRMGSKGKIHLNYQFNTGIHIPPAYLPMLNGSEYIKLQAEELYNLPGSSSFPRELAYDRDWDQFYNYSANTNWLDEVCQTGRSFNNYLNISGGNEKNRIYVSIDQNDQKGNIINTGYKRVVVNANYLHIFGKKLRLSFKNSFSNDNYDGNYRFDYPSGNTRSIYQMAYMKAPNMSVLEYDSEGAPTGDYFNPVFGYQENTFNPVAVSNLASADKKYSEYRASLNLDYRANEWLHLKQLLHYNHAVLTSRAELPESDLGFYWLPASYSGANITVNDDYWRSETRMMLEAPFTNESPHALGLYSSFIVNAFHYENIDLHSGESTFGPSFYHEKEAIANLNYCLKKRYLLSLNSRISTSTDINDPWKVYYGATAAWRFSKESILEDMRLLDEGSLRIEWYQTDTERGWFPLTNNIPQLVPLSDMSTISSNLDVSLWKKRIHIVAGVFQNKINISDWSASEYAVSKDQKGWDFHLEGLLIKRDKGDWSVFGNIAHSQLITEKLPRNFSYSQHINYFESVLALGERPGNIYGFINEGIYEEEADLFVRDPMGEAVLDPNGDPIFIYGFIPNDKFSVGDPRYQNMDNNDVINKDDQVYLGNSHPKFTGGFGSTLRYGNFSLSCQFHYSLGHQIINQLAMETELMNNKYNQSTATIYRWRSHGDEITENTLPRALLFSDFPEYGSSRYVESGSFLKLNNLQLGYDLDREICNKLRLQNLGIYLSAQRLYTMTPYTGLNPEVERDYSNLFWTGRDEIRINAPKMIKLSIRVGI